ncbi:MAG: PepSY domain-containing protein [Alphaproteobacteria bacterium]
MRKTRPFAGLMLTALMAATPALAQQGGAPDLFTILSNLQRNPAYQGEVLTTQPYYPRPGSPQFLYEVRILTPDDRIVIVYIDPMSGQIVPNPGG